MPDLDEARRMPRIARREAKALGAMSDSEVFEVELFGFEARQAVEKALKAWLALIGVEYPFIHDLETLFALLEQQGQIIADRFRNLEDLTVFAIQFRYAAFPDTAEQPDRDKLIRQVSSLLAHVEQLVREAEATG